MTRWEKFKHLIRYGFFGWENCKWFVAQLRDTFSNNPSYFSRKRIESFILYVNAMILLDAWYIYHFKEVDYVTALAVFGAQMVYAGYQVAQIRKDVLGEKSKGNEQK